MKRTLVLFFALLVLISLADSSDIKLDVQEHVLSNGMKILMIQNSRVPRVVCHIYYKVGSINERPGITGLAHLHEHMMFKGTRMMGVTDFEKHAAVDKQIDALMDKIYREKFWKADGGDREKIAQWEKEYDELVRAEKQYIIKDDLWTLYMKNGGTGLNASTGNETTGYYVTLPSNKIELQMLLESDRMQNAYFREYYSEKNVVMEERRLSENRPGYLFSEQVNAAFYSASPYHWDVIGWMDDLQKVNKADIIEFNERYYVPNNAVAIYVGDFDPENIIAMAEKYFGRIPKGPDIEPIRTYEPPQYSEKRMYGEGPAPTSLQMMFHTPMAGHIDAAPLSVLAVAAPSTSRISMPPLPLANVSKPLTWSAVTSPRPVRAATSPVIQESARWPSEARTSTSPSTSETRTSPRFVRSRSEPTAADTSIGASAARARIFPLTSSMRTGPALVRRSRENSRGTQTRTASCGPPKSQERAPVTRP
jgi:predicted Zn-dependent peptidase